MTDPIRRGAVYWIPDTSVNLPPNAGPTRKIKPKRPFLVISNDKQNDEAGWPVVLGFPLTTSDEFRSEFDVALKKGAGDLPEDCTVRVVLLQPIAKTKIGPRIGQLPANTVQECVARALDYMGAL